MKTSGIGFRSAQAGDTEGIVRVIRSGFEDHLLNMMIYGCHGAERYARELIGAGALGVDTRYTVAMVEDRVVGAVEMRRSPSELFLNYISVLPKARSRGLGRQLLAAALRDTRQPGHATMALDVFESNQRSIDWYAKLGFESSSSATDWWTFPLEPSEGGVAPGIVQDYAQSVACQERYGFSLFHLATSRGRYRIGRLGHEWFRIAQPELLQDAEALSLLSRIDPGRRGLGLFSETAPRLERLLLERLPEAKRVTRTHRMVADLDALEEKLASE